MKPFARNASLPESSSMHGVLLIVGVYCSVVLWAPLEMETSRRLACLLDHLSIWDQVKAMGGTGTFPMDLNLKTRKERRQLCASL